MYVSKEFGEMGKYSPAVALGRHISSLLPTEKSVNAMFNGDQVASTLTWVANKRFEISKFKFKFAIARTYEMRGARSRLYRSKQASKVVQSFF